MTGRAARAAVAACAFAALAVGGCQDRHGRVDPLRTGLLGAGIGGGLFTLGGLIEADQRGRRRYGRSYGHRGYGHAASRDLPPMAPPYGYGPQGYGW